MIRRAKRAGSWASANPAHEATSSVTGTASSLHHQRVQHVAPQLDQLEHAPDSCPRPADWAATRCRAAAAGPAGAATRRSSRPAAPGTARSESAAARATAAPVRRRARGRRSRAGASHRRPRSSGAWCRYCAEHDHRRHPVEHPDHRRAIAEAEVLEGVSVDFQRQEERGIVRPALRHQQRRARSCPAS